MNYAARNRRAHARTRVRERYDEYWSRRDARVLSSIARDAVKGKYTWGTAIYLGYLHTHTHALLVEYKGVLAPILYSSSSQTIKTVLPGEWALKHFPNHPAVIKAYFLDFQI